MSAKKLWAIILVVLVFLIGWFFFARERKIVNYPSSGTRVIAFGDSLIEGVGATQGNALPDQLSARLSVPIENYGVAGDTTRDGLNRIDEALRGEDPKVVLLLLGGNDFLRKVPREEIVANLEALITKIQARGGIVLLLGVRSGLIGGGFDDEFQTLSEKYGTVYVDDVLQGVFGHADLMADAIHPNDRGYAKIAERIAPVLEKLLK